MAGLSGGRVMTYVHLASSPLSRYEAPRVTFFNFDLFYYNFDLLFSYSNKQYRKKKPTKLSVPFSPLMYCLNTKLTIDSL